MAADSFIVVFLGKSQMTTRNWRPMVRKQKTLPSGPTVPPVSHLGPWRMELERWPCMKVPLLGTEKR